MKHFGWKELTSLAVLAVCAAVSGAQARVDAKGRPLLVMDDSLGYVPAQFMYKVGDDEFYVADITRPDWIRNRFQIFGTTGIFAVHVYAYHLSNRGLHGQMVEVSLEHKTATVYDFANPHGSPTVFSLTSSTSSLCEALNKKIIPQVRAELLAYQRRVYGQPAPPVGTYSPATN